MASLIQKSGIIKPVYDLIDFIEEKNIGSPELAKLMTHAFYRVLTIYFILGAVMGVMMAKLVSLFV